MLAAGRRHIPEQEPGGARDEDAQRGFDMRSTAEVYELFERLQQRQGQRGGGGDDGTVEFRRDGEGARPVDVPDEAVMRSGPLTGRRRRPGLVNSVDPDEDGTSGFDMRSTAEVSDGN